MVGMNGRPVAAPRNEHAPDIGQRDGAGFGVTSPDTEVKRRWPMMPSAAVLVALTTRP
jgi:hypothetical protein